MTPLLAFCFLLLISTPAHGQLWFSDASVLFTIANSIYTDNEQVAAYVIKQLDLDWTDDDGTLYEYMVFVNDESVSGSDYINTGLFDKDIDYHELVDHNKIMKAFRFPKDKINCADQLDENTFGTILNLSVTSTSTAESMAKAVLSMDNFNFNALGFIVNGETAKQGFKATSGFDQNCYTKYQYSTKWLIHYFGEKVAGDATKPDYIILDSLLNDLQSNTPAPPNSYLAYSIQDKLEANNRGYFWVVMVNDVSATLNFDVQPGDLAYWTDKIQVENFCGKNVEAFGVSPDKKGECKPGYNPTFHYEEVVNTIIAASGSIPQNVTKALVDACDDFGTEAKLVIVVKDKNAGLEYITDRDCTFHLTDTGKDYKVLMYSLLKSLPTTSTPTPSTSTTPA